MVRIVLDTNVLVSALIAVESTPGKAMDKAEREALMLASPSTLSEAYEVLVRPKFSRFLPLTTRIELFNRYREGVQIVSIVFPIRACRDPHDDKFLEVAINGKADILVTGDQDLLALDPFQGVRILTPQQYLVPLAHNSP
jgi:putative PIN family toxin of toxin-antitoxin system